MNVTDWLDRLLNGYCALCKHASFTRNKKTQAIEGKCKNKVWFDVCDPDLRIYYILHPREIEIDDYCEFFERKKEAGDKQ